MRAFLTDRPPEIVSKSMKPRETSLQKSKKRRAIALAALGGCGGLGQLWEALAELWEALGELWEGLEELWKSSGRLWGRFGRVWRSSGRALGASLYRKTPDQPHSGRYVKF